MTDIADSKIFDFGGAFGELRAEKPKPRLSASADSGELNVLQALVAAEEAAYRWDIASDTITWSANVSEILGCKLETIKTGRHFASMLDSENLTTRYDAVFNSKERDLGPGVSFQVEYALRPQADINGSLIHLEDNGQWQAGADGTPKVVFGTLRRIDARFARERKLSFLGTNDPLTGMMNRGRMTEALAEAINSSQKSGTHCAFAIAAINNLNLVNDAYGFDYGNEVIVQVSHRLKHVMRMGDGIARYSGNKFGFILKECSETELATALARFSSAIRENAVGTGKGPVWTSISIGAVALPQNADTAAMAISNAEEALSDAMRQAENSSLIYQPSASREAKREFNSRCAIELIKCLREETCRLAYQPIVDAQTGQPIMYEALLRLPEADGQSDLSVAEIIPLAERLGLAHLIDRAVLQLIIQALHENPDLRLNMNVSSTTVGDAFRQDQLLDLLNSNKAVAGRLTMEFSETATLANLKSARRFIECLHDVGTSVAIDHFGQGYASMRHLRELPINLVKLDGSLCKNISNHPENKILVRSLVELAKNSSIKIVAEWIESQEDAEVLAQLGADYLQGYHIGQPSLDKQWPVENLEVSATPQQPPEMDTQEDPQEVPLAENSTVAPQTITDVPQAQPVSEFDVPLDFSAIDDSIAKLRAALDGLSPTPSAAEPDDKSVNAA
ncbi:MAG TPA: bifunctional diguanylate cyclase/phosphodiesterase [Aestuariivirga sp.]